MVSRPYYFLAEGIYEGIVRNSSDYIVDQIRLSEFPNEDETSYSYSEVLLSLKEFGRSKFFLVIHSFMC